MNKKEYNIPATRIITVNDEGILASFTAFQTGTSSNNIFTPSESIEFNEDEKEAGATSSAWNATLAD